MTDKVNQTENDRVRNFMDSFVTGETRELKDKSTDEPKKIVRKPVLKKKKELLTKTYDLPFGGVITRATRTFNEDEAEEHRHSLCEKINDCIKFSMKKRMTTFSCKNCSFFK